jgi:hypothetical protein
VCAIVYMPLVHPVEGEHHSRPSGMLSAMAAKANSTQLCSSKALTVCSVEHTVTTTGPLPGSLNNGIINIY